MNTLLIVLCIVVGLVIVSGAAVAILKDAVKAALTSLFSLLGSLVAALCAPSVEGTGDFSIDLGFLHAGGHSLRVNSSQPGYIWAVAFICITFLTAIAVSFVGLLALRAQPQPIRPAPTGGA
jgi:hypothetical protein